MGGAGGEGPIGGDRPVSVHVPPSYESGKPAPLLLMLHGYISTGALEEAYLQITPESDKRGFLYAYPDGTVDPSGSHFWNATDACCAGPKAATLFQPGNHGTTFGGNPLAMRAGVETIRIMEEDGLLDNAATVGAHLKGALARELGGHRTSPVLEVAAARFGVDVAHPEVVGVDDEAGGGKRSSAGHAASHHGTRYQRASRIHFLLLSGSSLTPAHARV